MKKIKKTFADSARMLLKKYSKAAFDKIEADELEAAMEKLVNEQEMVRSAMGLNEQPQQVQQFATGGFTPYGFNNIFSQRLPQDAYLIPEQLSYMGSPMNAISGVDMPLKKTQSTKPIFKGGNKPTNTAPVEKPQFQPANEILFRTNNNSLTDNRKYADWSGLDRVAQDIKVPGLEVNKLKSFGQGQVNKAMAMDTESESFWDKNKQFLPQAIGGLSNIGGNLLLSAMSKKAPQISPAITTPEKINLEPKAEQLRRDADVSKNINMTNARNLGLNPGATLGNLGVINSGIDRGLGANLTDLYMGQEQANVGATNQFALQNQDAINRVNMINSQMKFQKEDDRMNYIAQALSVPANIAKEITMAKSDKEMKAILDRYYQSMGRNYQTQGSIYGENAFTTKVRK